MILLKKQNITGYQYQIKQEKLYNVAVRDISCTGIEVRDISCNSHTIAVRDTALFEIPQKHGIENSPVRKKNPRETDYVIQSCNRSREDNSKEIYALPTGYLNINSTSSVR
jgi:hypothetical protein